MKSSINHPKKKQGVPSIRLQATRTNKTKHALYRVMAENDATNDRDDVTQDFYEGFLFRENFNHSMTPHHILSRCFHQILSLMFLSSSQYHCEGWLSRQGKKFKKKIAKMSFYLVSSWNYWLQWCQDEKSMKRCYFCGRLCLSGRSVRARKCLEAAQSDHSEPCEDS